MRRLDTDDDERLSYAEFFEGIITSENEGSVEDVYEKLKRLVLLA